jgi:hypothetical protein
MHHEKGCSQEQQVYAEPQEQDATRLVDLGAPAAVEDVPKQVARMIKGRISGGSRERRHKTWEKTSSQIFMNIPTYKKNTKPGSASSVFHPPITVGANRNRRQQRKVGYGAMARQCGL